MPTLEERVAFLEGKIEEHSHGFGEIRDLIIHLNARVDTLDQKVDRFREELSTRINALDQKVERFREELSARIDRLDARIDALDAKFSRFFPWTIGIQVTVPLAVIGALLAK